MIHTRFLVTPHDTTNQVFVLRRFVGKLVVKEAYCDLTCKRCRKVDEKAALARGLDESIVVKSKRPFVLSTDDFYLVDERAVHILEQLVPNLLDLTPIPQSAYFVASPKLWLQPVENDPGFRFCDVRCLECGRPREVVWGKVPPKVPDLPQIAAVNVEGQLGARAIWIVSPELAIELKKLKSQLTGIVIRPKEVDDGRPVQ